MHSNLYIERIPEGWKREKELKMYLKILWLTEGGRETQEEGNVCTPMVNSC